MNLLNQGMPAGRLHGALILAHDVLRSAPDLVGPLVDLMKDKGYTLTTVAGCLGDPEPYKDSDPFSGVRTAGAGLRKRGLDVSESSVHLGDYFDGDQSQWASSKVGGDDGSLIKLGAALVIGFLGGFVGNRRLFRWSLNNCVGSTSSKP